MHLKQLSLSGFKSFAKKTTLQFTQGITAIVGPNGSGKSNLAESIRWVMGEQSIKTLRGKKSEDVIFSGSDKKTRLGLAEVCLELDNSDKQVPIDYSELVITRRVYRSGESDYLINTTLSNTFSFNSNFNYSFFKISNPCFVIQILLSLIVTASKSNKSLQWFLTVCQFVLAVRSKSLYECGFPS